MIISLCWFIYTREAIKKSMLILFQHKRLHQHKKHYTSVLIVQSMHTCPCYFRLMCLKTHYLLGCCYLISKIVGAPQTMTSNGTRPAKSLDPSSFKCFDSIEHQVSYGWVGSYILAGRNLSEFHSWYPECESSILVVFA